jgi:hypothetical protein
MPTSKRLRASDSRARRLIQQAFQARFDNTAEVSFENINDWLGNNAVSIVTKGVVNGFRAML